MAYIIAKILDYECKNFKAINYSNIHIAKFFDRYKDMLSNKNESVINFDAFGKFIDYIFEKGVDLKNISNETPELGKFYKLLNKSVSFDYIYAFLGKFETNYPDGILLIKYGETLQTVFPLNYEEFKSSYMDKMSEKNPMFLSKKEYGKAIDYLKTKNTISIKYFKNADATNGIWWESEKGNGDRLLINIKTSHLIPRETMEKLKAINCRNFEELKKHFDDYFYIVNSIKTSLETKLPSVFKYGNYNSFLSEDKKQEIINNLGNWIKKYFSNETLPKLDGLSSERMKTLFKVVLHTETTDFENKLNQITKQFLKDKGIQENDFSFEELQKIKKILNESSK